MNDTYSVYDLKTGQWVARIEADGRVSEEGEPRAITTLRRLLQREITVRESAGPAAVAGTTPQDEEYEPFPEEQMCYFGLVTLQPGEPGHVAAVLQRLPYITYYEARIDV